MSSLDMMDLLKQVSSEFIEPRFQALTDNEIQSKTPGDFVTIADRQAEEALSVALLAANPEAVVVGEEACFADPTRLGAVGEAEHCFVVDPLDGTNNFVRGSENFAVMVAELRGAQLAASWIWQPRFGLGFSAEHGCGVFCNGVRLRPLPLQQPPLGASSFPPWRGIDAGGRLAPVVKSTRSAGIDYPNVVTGAIDFIVFRFPKPWDHLPGQLMLQELGGDIVHADGRLYRPGSGRSAILACRDAGAGEQLAALWPWQG
ncbi:inositol monophosphatase family protein [Propionibacterium sp.]|uniref:inositol monophosphatase family protein n=1 Tax=Propionibacterium sp. TaxID=1977903 RepID=UPI0039EB8F70